MIVEFITQDVYMKHLIVDINFLPNNGDYVTLALNESSDESIEYQTFIVKSINHHIEPTINNLHSCNRIVIVIEPC